MVVDVEISGLEAVSDIKVSGLEEIVGIGKPNEPEWDGVDPVMGLA